MKAPEKTLEVIRSLPGRDCGICGFRTCAELAEAAGKDPSLLKRCVYLESEGAAVRAAEIETSWKDILGREFDFILDKFDDDPGPRETILPFNPVNVERLGVKKGDILVGRPAAAGCPVAHCGVVMDEPDYFNGLVTWCIVGPMPARERGVDIGLYTPIAYEGVVRRTRTELKFGMRYYFLPRYCVLQSRHSGLVNTVSKTKDGYLVRVESIWIA